MTELLNISFTAGYAISSQAFHTKIYPQLLHAMADEKAAAVIRVRIRYIK